MDLNGVNTLAPRLNTRSTDALEGNPVLNSNKANNYYNEYSGL